MPDLGHKRCSKCGYDLTGLPGVGACPECNELFNTFTGEGVKTPPPASAQVEHTARLVKAGALGAFALFLVLCSGVIQLLVPQGHALVLGCVIAVLPALWAITSYMEDKN